MRAAIMDPQEPVSRWGQCAYESSDVDVKGGQADFV